MVASGSDTDDSGDDNLKNLLDAVDTTLLNDDLFKSTKESEEIMPKKSTQDLPKSQRYIEADNEPVDNSGPSESMQKFFSKKLSQIISSQIEFIDNENDETNNLQEKKKKKKDKRNQTVGNVVKLLKDFDTPIKTEDTTLIWQENRKKPKIIRRIVEPDNLKESEKCKRVAIEPNFIYSGEEVKHWSKRSKAEVFEYKRSKNGPKNCFFYVESPQKRDFQDNKKSIKR